MHITHLLVGLAGLTLSVAAPTPGNADALELSKIKLCDALHQQGTCKVINANMACVELGSSLKHNLNSIVQDKGIMCAYHQGDGCQNLAFLIDSSHDTQTADVDPKWSPVVTNIQCIPGREGLKPSSLAASLSAKIEDLPPIPKSTPAIATRQSPIGDALICSPDITTGPCAKVPASGACTDLPANVDRKVRTIYQNGGSHCEFFKSDDCQGRLGWSDAKQSMWFTVPDAVGDRMGSAFCQRSMATGESAVGGETGGFVEEEVV